MRTVARYFVIVIFCMFAGLSFASDQPSSSDQDPVQTVRFILNQPEEEIDFARAKLAFDKIVDPSINVDASLIEITKMVHAIRVMAGPLASDARKLAAIRTYVYVSGAWNGYNPYQYDHSDPLGENISNKLLPNYMMRRRGNCVSMPFLFIILADRMGLHVTASLAPFHFFVKLIDDTSGAVVNLEATSGASPTRDLWIRQQFPMTDKSIASGVYLKTLTKKETVAAMAAIVVEGLAPQKRYNEIIDVAEVILRYYPQFAFIMAKQGDAYSHIIADKYTSKYSNPRDIPLSQQGDYFALLKKNLSAFDRAEALGWRGDE